MSPCKDRSTTSSSAAPGRASGSSAGGGGASLPAARRSSPPPKPWRRTSFPCVSCGKTFPTQQAMAGHSSTHVRGTHAPAGQVAEPASAVRRRGRPRHWSGAAQGPSAAAAAPAPANQVVQGSLDVSYFPFVPVFPMGNQQQAARSTVLRPSQLLPSVDVTMVPGPAAAAARAAVQRHVQAVQAAVRLGLGPFLPHRVLLPLPAVPFNAMAAAAAAAAPGLLLTPQHASLSAMMVPPQVRVDLTLRLASGGGGGNIAQRMASAAALSLGPPVQDGGDEAAVMDGGDQGRQVGKDMDGIDLELSLRR